MRVVNMDHRLNVNDPPRPGPLNRPADMPLVTMAWRALRADYSHRRQEEEAVGKALLAAADEIERLRKAAAGSRKEHSEDGTNPLPETLHGIADALETILNRMGLEIVAPAGEPYALGHMEILESIAQIAKSGIHGPMIHEVVQPAVVYGGELLRMGKVVIAWPAGE
jgi:molecular chaperone GrpE (heat shock protein)